MDQIKLLNVILFNFLIGNADAHGKNFSLLYWDDKPSLAPIYDLLSTSVYPALSKKMAMKIGGTFRPDGVGIGHFHKLIANTKTSQSMMNRLINTMRRKIRDEAYCLREELSANGLYSDIFDKIIKTIEQRLSQLDE